MTNNALQDELAMDEAAFTNATAHRMVCRKDSDHAEGPQRLVLGIGLIFGRAQEPRTTETRSGQEVGKGTANRGSSDVICKYSKA